MKRVQQHLLNIVATLLDSQQEPVSSKYKTAKDVYKLRVSLLHSIKNWTLITIGIFSATLGLQSFLLPNSFIDGGVMGISLLTRALTDLPLAMLIIGINIPFLILGYTQISKQFAIKSIVAITGLGQCVGGAFWMERKF